MHPTARLSAIVELFDAVFHEWQEGRQMPADAAFQRYTKARRFIGAKDRRALAEGYYSLWRRFGLLRWAVLAADHELTGRSLQLAGLAQDGRLGEESALFGQVPHALEALTEPERRWLGAIDWHTAPAAARANLPEWLYEKLVAQFGDAAEAELAALAQPAPFTVRANTLNAAQPGLVAELNSLGYDARPTRWSPDGVTLSARVAAGNLAALAEGRAEIQDESSQIAVRASGVAPGMRVVDLCAGAGGKTLALAALMKNEGRILATDLNLRRLADLAPRAQRASVDIVQSFTLPDPDAPLPKGWGQADVVFVDAPCTGLGTMRRNPDAAWRTTPHQLEQLRLIQAALLQRAIKIVRPGGRLIYATCSLLEEENDAQIIPLLNGNFTLSVVPPEKLWDKASPLREDPLCALPMRDEKGPGVTLTPLRHGTDGFYFAALHKREG